MSCSLLNRVVLIEAGSLIQAGGFYYRKYGSTLVIFFNCLSEKFLVTMHINIYDIFTLC